MRRLHSPDGFRTFSRLPFKWRRIIKLMESQFDPRLLLLLDGKGSKLFKASILPAADVSCAFLLCAKQWMLLRCFYSSVVSLIALQDKQTFPHGQISTLMLRQEAWEFIPVGSSHIHTHAHTCTHVSRDCLRKQNSHQKRRWKGTKCTRLVFRWLHVIKIHCKTSVEESATSDLINRMAIRCQLYIG